VGGHQEVDPAADAQRLPGDQQRDLLAGRRSSAASAASGELAERIR
jgi:hypothetical protein